MEEKKTYDRKFFLKITALILTVIPLGLTFPLLEKFKNSSLNKKNKELPADLPDGVTFAGEVIAFKSGDTLKTFSSKCTHLGCIIKNRDTSGNLVCSCHGSVFTKEGVVTTGPASSDLKVLKWQKNIKTGKIIVEDISV